MQQLDAATFVDSLQKQQRTFLDIRTPEEYHDGSITYAKNLDRRNQQGFQQYVEKLDKDGISAYGQLSSGSKCFLRK